MSKSVAMTLAPDAMSWLDAHGGEFVHAVSPACMPLAPHARTDCQISLPAEHTSKTTRGAGNDGANGLELHTGHSAARSLLFVRAAQLRERSPCTLRTLRSKRE